MGRANTRFALYTTPGAGVKLRTHMRNNPAACVLTCVFGAFALSVVSASAPFAGAAPAPTDALREWLAKPREGRPELNDQAFAKASLTKEQAGQAKQLLWDDHLADLRATREKEWKDEAITVSDHTLRFKHRQFGEKPKDGWSLYISMHGGGNAPAEVNDQQWENQVRLYTPKEGLYIAPRAPTNTWNLWHEGHMDDLFDRLLEDA
ncbi:MAG: hypothetical protein JWO87_1959, partial [Phycisphaerales bacterium]|nr:hypothetical protein [Phycisphaerales bacterium]